MTWSLQENSERKTLGSRRTREVNEIIAKLAQLMENIC